jgi:hypothetical protein
MDNESKNEYDVMPSMGIFYPHIRRIKRETINEVDMTTCEEICRGYGFKCGYISDTFMGGGYKDFIVYQKLDIDPVEYRNLITAQDWKAVIELDKPYIKRIYDLHDCIHALDLQTPLYFEVAWVGNCGIFGSDDVYRQSYCGGRDITSWESIINHWATCIHDTTRVLSKGVYLIASTDSLKPSEDAIMHDFTTEQALDICKEFFPKEKFTIMVGKRACDTNTEPYKAILIGDEGIRQKGVLRFVKNKNGMVTMCSSAPLCGEQKTSLLRSSMRESIRSAVLFIIN